MTASSITIYHNPACSSSRRTLDLIRAAGFEPVIIEYLKNPPEPATLAVLLERMGMGPRQLLRAKEPCYAQLGLDGAQLSDAVLLTHMHSHPILINRPIVVTARGVRLCRPPESVLEILPPAG